MVVYLFLLVTGVIGYVAMMALGFSHGFGHGGNGGGHSHGPSLGHGHGHAEMGMGHHAPLAHHTPGAHAPAAHHGAAPHHAATHTSEPAQNIGLSVLALFSPFNLFSLMIGAGLTGVALQNFLTAQGLMVAAVLGAVIFTVAFVRPLMGFFMRFASEPAKGLEGAVAQTAIAEAGFDERGRGVVTVTIDGELTRLLARLPESETTQKVKRGEELVILEVDAKKGSCVVTTQFRANP